MEQNTISVKMIVLLCQTTFYLHKYKQVTGRIQGLCGLCGLLRFKGSERSRALIPGDAPPLALQGASDHHLVEDGT